MKTKLETAQLLVEAHKAGSALYAELCDVRVAAQNEKVIPLTLAFAECQLKTEDLIAEFRHIKAREEMGIK